jgi:hypothetical protein
MQEYEYLNWLINIFSSGLMIKLMGNENIYPFDNKAF